MSIFRRIDERAEMMGRMMQVVGVNDFADTGLALESQLRTAFFRCQACRASGECQDWLTEHEVAAEAPSFCPNADFFAASTGGEGAPAL
jgi:hypothetical protein